MGSQRVAHDWATELYCRASLCKFKKPPSSGGWITKRAPFFGNRGQFYHSFTPQLGTLVRGIFNDTRHTLCPDLWGSWKTRESSLRISGERESWMGLPRWLSSRESAEATGDWSSIPGWGRSPGGGNSNPCQYSCGDSPVNRGAWWATVRGVAKSRTRLSSEHAHTGELLEGRGNFVIWQVGPGVFYRESLTKLRGTIRK